MVPDDYSSESRTNNQVQPENQNEQNDNHGNVKRWADGGLGCLQLAQIFPMVHIEYVKAEPGAEPKAGPQRDRQPPQQS